MRHFIVTALVAVAALVAAAGPASAQQPVYVGVMNTSHRLVPKQHPRTWNTWYPWLSHAQSAGTLERLVWRSWGQSTAYAKGVLHYTTARVPVKVRVYRIRIYTTPEVSLNDQPLDFAAYTRLTVTTRYGTGTLRLPWGTQLWPGYE